MEIRHHDNLICKSRISATVTLLIRPVIPVRHTRSRRPIDLIQGRENQINIRRQVSVIGDILVRSSLALSYVVVPALWECEWVLVSERLSAGFCGGGRESR